MLVASSLVVLMLALFIGVQQQAERFDQDYPVELRIRPFVCSFAIGTARSTSRSVFRSMGFVT